VAPALTACNHWGTWEVPARLALAHSAPQRARRCVPLRRATCHATLPARPIRRDADGLLHRGRRAGCCPPLGRTSTQRLRTILGGTCHHRRRPVAELLLPTVPRGSHRPRWNAAPSGSPGPRPLRGSGLDTRQLPPLIAPCPSRARGASEVLFSAMRPNTKYTVLQRNQSLKLHPSALGTKRPQVQILSPRPIEMVRRSRAISAVEGHVAGRRSARRRHHSRDTKPDATAAPVTPTSTKHAGSSSSCHCWARPPLPAVPSSAAVGGYNDPLLWREAAQQSPDSSV
jgi:hypothetical protein